MDCRLFILGFDKEKSLNGSSQHPEMEISMEPSALQPPPPPPCSSCQSASSPLVRSSDEEL